MIQFINTSNKKILPRKSPQQEDEESPMGHMPDPESDDDVDLLNKPFDDDLRYTQVDEFDDIEDAP